MDRKSLYAADHSALHSVKIGVILLMLSILASCSGTRKLADDEYALNRNSFKIITDDKRVPVNQIREDLKNAVKQEPVRKNILNPRTYGKPLTVFDRVRTLESVEAFVKILRNNCLLYTSPSPRDATLSRMPSSA